MPIFVQNITMLTAKYIKESATICGFDLCGTTEPREFCSNREHYLQWLGSGAAESLPYMQQYLDVRFDPRALMEGCVTAVVCGVNYKNQYSLNQGDGSLPKIASYALCRDYHRVIRKQLKALLKELQLRSPSLRGRCCVDTAPLLEKQLAYEAGLGWIGRQSLIVTPQFGTFVTLGVLLLDERIDLYDSPLDGVGCGGCHRCVDSCPNGAIAENRTIDSRLCISAQSVECEHTESSLGGWAFGCDECQSCCPYNRNSPLSTNPDIQPIFTPISGAEWQGMTPEEFTKKLNPTAMKRAGLERIVRNVMKR